MSADNQTAMYLDETLLAKAMTSDLEKVEGNWYFKESALIDRSKYTESKTHSHCPWKGDASYYNFTTDEGKEIKDIAWYYPHPMKGAEMVDGRVAFYVSKVKGLHVGVPPVV